MVTATLALTQTAILPYQEFLESTRTQLEGLLGGSASDALAATFVNAVLHAFFVDAEWREAQSFADRYGLSWEDVLTIGQALQKQLSRALHHAVGELIPSYRYRYMLQIGGAREGIHVTATLPTPEDALEHLRSAESAGDYLSPRYRR